MGSVVYLTGAPATGKSTLCAGIRKRAPNSLVLSYSTLLREHLRQRDGPAVDAAEIREKSSRIVTHEDVMAVDARLIDEVNHKRGTHQILIDSHPVTKESYGFRVTPFKSEQLKALSPDAIVCLYAPPEVLRDRITCAPDGRPLPSLFELGLHIEMQAAVALQYAVNIGRSCYLIDSSMTPDALVDAVRAILDSSLR